MREVGYTSKLIGKFFFFKFSNIYLKLENGELVPRVPVYMSCSSFMNAIVDKIHEKIDLVKDFIHQKRNGKFNLAILVS